MRNDLRQGFPGGIHPTDGSDKALTAGKKIRTYLPDRVWISMEQNPGGKCEPLVKKGDRVVRGQKIGDPRTFTASAVHASINGIVTDIKEGKNAIYCAIQAEGEQPSRMGQAGIALADLSGFDREKIVSAIREGGLVGMGGAGFPAAVKYSPKSPVDVLLINAAECEPYLSCDDRLMIEQPIAVLNGVRLLWKASGAEKVFLCLEDNKPEAAKILGELTETISEPIQVKTLPTRYPQGGERQLIQAVTGREVPSGGLPADVGVIVSNVGTAKAAADILLNDEPLTSRIVTITGEVKEPANFLVPIGTSIQELIEAAGGVKSTQNRVILGGPMTGNCIAVDYDGKNELGFVTKTTSGVVVLPPYQPEESPCIRCGGCASVCPAGLIPWQIDFAERQGNPALCEKLDAAECIACGCCSYICPAKRELSFHTRQARDQVKQRIRERMVRK
ncbi:MAG: electron transport complex subunit RsxC [Candidatus Merdivicinus sp.]|jgi:electron transport complex protein RnfC